METEEIMDLLSSWVRSSKLAHFAHLIWPTSTIPDAMRCWTGSAKRPKANRPARCAGKCRKWLLPAEAPSQSCQNCPHPSYSNKNWWNAAKYRCPGGPN